MVICWEVRGRGRVGVGLSASSLIPNRRLRQEASKD